MTNSSQIFGAYPGIEGSHSQQVLDAWFKGAGDELAKRFQPLGVLSFRQVANAVVSGRAQVGILPVDNAIAGTIREGYDLLAQYDLVPISEVQWRMEHKLLAPKGASLDTIREVHGHPLALEECGKFLATLAGAKIIPSEDTGLAAKLVAESGDTSKAAVAPPHAAALYGLTEIAGNIADHPENYTRFIVFRAPQASPEVRALDTRYDGPGSRRKTSLLMATAHAHGALSQCLTILSEAGFNLSKLESRPKLGKAWEYLFYLDVEGDVRDPKLAQAIQKLRAHTVFLQVIGSYEAHLASSSAAVEQPPTAAQNASAAAHGDGTTDGRLAGWSPELLPATAKTWPKVARSAKPSGTRVTVGGVEIGGSEFIVMAGPCSVESREQVMATAQAVRAAGARVLRGGAFKPRTNPYAFQGMGFEGLGLLAEAGRANGMPIISEVMSLDQVERMAREVDIFQIGARNMQNFDLLKAVGKTDRPVMLKRGMSASIEEWLGAAEYILAEGNPNVMFCERGIRTFETATRNTLDLSAVPVLRERTHLPVIVDPSHGVGVRRWIRPLCRAAKAVGAHAIIVEVHPNPAEAKSDKDQALTFDDFRTIMSDLGRIPNDPDFR